MRVAGDFENTRAKVTRSGRTIYFFDVVDELSVMEAIRLITQLQCEDSKKAITFILSTPGGNCYDGLALYDCLRSTEVPIVMIATGLVASMGFIIYLAGDYRTAFKNATFMNHQVSSSFEGKLTDIEIQRKEINRLEDTCLNIISERTGIDAKIITQGIKVGDYYYTAEQAVEAKVVHQILPETEKIVKFESKPKRKKSR